MNPVTKTIPVGCDRGALAAIVKTQSSQLTRPCHLCGSGDLAIKQATKYYCHSCAPKAMHLDPSQQLKVA